MNELRASWGLLKRVLRECAFEFSSCPMKAARVLNFTEFDRYDIIEMS